MDIESIVQALNVSLLPDTAKNREATRFLEEKAKLPGSTVAFFQIVGNNAVDLHIRLAAATFVKNHVKRNWSSESETPICDADRDAVRAHVVRLMLEVPPIIQRQISDALAHISLHDFPDRWPRLLPELVAELSATSDPSRINGILDTVGAIFARFKFALDSEENVYALSIALKEFAEPLTNTFERVDGLVDQAIAANAGAPVQAPLFSALVSCVDIFFCLNYIDLPVFFEDNISKWMQWFHKYLSMKNPVVSSLPDDTEEGKLEQLQWNILECVAIYSEKYDEEFEPFFSTFVTDTWTLLSSHSTEKLEALNMDNLIVRALKFLSSVVSKTQHTQIFGDPNAQKAMFDSAIVPNIKLREGDLELFEDNPADFIRGDIDGAVVDTRRRISIDFVRSYSRCHNATITPLALSIIQTLLSDGQEKSKDAAIALMIAITIKTQTEVAITATNELVNISEFLTTHILPELQNAPDTRPIAKAACIKFVATFRSIFKRDELHQLLVLLAPLLGANNYVVHTYAAAAFEKILHVMDRTEEPAAPGSAPGAAVSTQKRVKMTPRVDPNILVPVLPNILGGLFSRILTPNYPENEYMMKCIMRLIVTCRELIAPVAPQLIEGLTKVLANVCKNVGNPNYNHYLFESIGAAVRFFVSAATSQAGPGSDALLNTINSVEHMIFPPFQVILEQDLQEFLPYVFQILSLVLRARGAAPHRHPITGATYVDNGNISDRNSKNSQNVHSLSAGYQALLSPCLQAVLWQKKGNIPALTQLLVAYIRRGAPFLQEQNHLTAILGIWQNLLNSKTNDAFSFQILGALWACMPLATLQPFMSTIMMSLLTKVHSQKSLRLARMFSHIVLVFAGTHGASALEVVLDAVGAGTFLQVLSGVILTTANRVISDVGRKECCYGLVKILVLPTILSGPGAALFPRILSVIMELHQKGAVDDSAGKKLGGFSAATTGGASVDAMFGEEDSSVAAPDGDQEYSAAFIRLVYSSVPHTYEFEFAPEVDQLLVQELNGAKSVCPSIPQMIAASPVAEAVRSLAASKGLAL